MKYLYLSNLVNFKVTERDQLRETMKEFDLFYISVLLNFFDPAG